MVKQKRYSAQLKFQVVLESLHRKRPDAELARAYGVHRITLAKWKKEFLASWLVEGISSAILADISP